MKAFLSLDVKSSKRLYIPHGSDERWEYHRHMIILGSFISHMVQMKESSVQVPNIRAFTLYPTWFRWKDNKIWKCAAPRSLYIPHGSDESASSSSFSPQSSTFISHMVQMKESYSDHLIILMISLYPTWFRWKTPEKYISLIKEAFISHMVQMKVYKTSSTAHQVCTLYPTWFRWKPNTFEIDAPTIILYIPHGSDERSKSLVLLRSIDIFISHMVQMKAYILMSLDETAIIFISHMVQMKEGL